MGLIGVYNPHGLGVRGDDFVDVQRSRSTNVAGTGLEVLKFPEGDPEIAVVFSTNGNLPIEWAVRTDGSFIVVDGEIFNWATLTAHRGLAKSSSTTDPAGLLEAYFDQGEAVLAKVDGAALITIWDATERKLVFARDRSGITAGFYNQGPENFMWSSEISPLLAAGVPWEINLPALDYFLGAHYVPSPWSIVKDITKLPPAHLVSLDDTGKCTLSRYWKPTGQPKFQGSLTDQVDQMGDIIRRAIEKRMSKKGQTGILLSGGVDSMLVAALCANAGHKPETYTFRYTDYEGTLNEAAPARAAADFFGLNHTVIPFSPRDLADNIDEMVRIFGEPFDYGVHSYMVKQVAASGVDVVLTGVGPDGWYLSPTSRLGLAVARLPSIVYRMGETFLPVLRSLSAVAAEKAAGVFQEARVGMPIVAYPRETGGAFRATLFQDGVYEHAGQCRRPPQMSADFAALAGESAHDRLTFAGTNYYSADTILHWNTAWSQANDMAIRHPYFDSELYDFMMRLPRCETGKKQFRELAARVMPHDMAFATKVYQAAPLSHWFRGPLRDFLRDRLAPERLKANNLFDPDVVTRILDRHIAGDEDHQWTLMMLLTITVWQEQAR
jgi:asparagine synthase (glutamine-hydrolysing)